MIRLAFRSTPRTEVMAVSATSDNFRLIKHSRNVLGFGQESLDVTHPGDQKEFCVLLLPSLVL